MDEYAETLPFFNVALPQDDDDMPIPPRLDSDEDPEFGRYEDTGAPPVPALEHLELAQQYIKCVRDATLENSGLSKTIIDRIRKPVRKVLELAKHTALRLSLRQFIANGHSDDAYEANRRACMEEHPERDLPSLKVLKLVDTSFSLEALEPTGDGLLLSLVAILRALKHHGLRLDRLELENPVDLTEIGLTLLKATPCETLVRYPEAHEPDA